MAGKSFAFSSSFEAFFVISRDLNTIFQQQMSVNMFTNSGHLFSVVAEGNHRAEKLFMKGIPFNR